MNITPLKYGTNYSTKLNQVHKNSFSKIPSFKGKNEEYALPNSEQCSFYCHPLFTLQIQLLKDGYSPEEIKEAGIFEHTQIKTSNIFDDNFVKKAIRGDINKEQIFSNKTKELMDILTLQKAYSLLKEKYNSSDVQEEIALMQQIEQELIAIMREKGKNLEQRVSTTGLKREILHVLHYVDAKNIVLLEELLNDENFNNCHIKKALLKLDPDKDSEYGLKTLKKAQKIGYEKDFSPALSILISEANEENMPIIEKMLNEQKFLTNNDDFVSTELMSFLRNRYPTLAETYRDDYGFNLYDVEEMLNIERENLDNFEDFEDFED